MKSITFLHNPVKFLIRAATLYAHLSLYELDTSALVLYIQGKRKDRAFMIKNSFSILQGVGEKIERRLWANGIRSWDDFLAADEINFLGLARKRLYDESLHEAALHLDQEDAQYFAKALRGKEHWRLFPSFRKYAVALDIESNGFMPAQGGYATIVGLYDGTEYKALVKGRDLTRENIERELSRYKYLITFFGSGYDIPFLNQTLGVSFRMPHFDLSFAGKRAGLKGGLKKLEDQFGIQREDTVKGINGYDAVKLWRAAKQGDSEALELLIAYNRCDTVNLFALAERLYSMLRDQSGVAAVRKVA